jgi:hypothetical protein
MTFTQCRRKGLFPVSQCNGIWYAESLTTPSPRNFETPKMGTQESRSVTTWRDMPGARKAKSWPTTSQFEKIVPTASVNSVKKQELELVTVESPAECPKGDHLQPRSSGDPDANETPPKSDNQQSWARLWMWELAAIALAVGILVAIGVILSVHDGKPIPRWRLGVNINSLVAILTTLLRALIMVFIAEGLYACPVSIMVC